MIERIVRWGRIAGLSAALSAASAGARGGQGGSAKALVQASGVKGGLIVHVGGRDPRWTAALRVSDRYVVQGLRRDAAGAAEAAAYLREHNLAGPVSAIAWDGEHLPYADNLVNLLIADSPKAPPAAEIRRVLAPGGVAYVRPAGGASEGGWAKRTKPWPDDIDEWTHFLRGPDNNAVADDTRVGPPRHMQWIAGPKWARSHDHLASISAAVTAAGRLFYIADEGPMASVKAPSTWRLVARDAFNGVLLWKRDLSPWEDQLRPFRSGPAELPRRLVAVGDRVYVTLGYGRGVTALDAATGEVVREYEHTANTHEIVAQGPRLYFVVSEPLAEASPTTGKVLRRFEVWRGAYSEYVTQYMPKHLRAVDARTGKVVWTKKDREARDLLPLTLIADGDRVFFQNPAHLVALSAASGKVLWRADRPAIRHRYAWQTPTLVVKDGVVLSADRSPEKPVDTGGEDATRLEWRVSANHILAGGEMVAFSAATGKKLWTVPCHEGFNSPADVFVVGGRVWSGELAWRRQPGTTKVYDLHTGKVVATRKPDQEMYTFGFGHHRCYRNKATTKYAIHGRAGVEFFDLAGDRVVADHWVRGGCQYGILPANGLLYAPSHPCACYVTAKLSGFNALSARRARPFRKHTDRLQKGPAYNQIRNPQSAIRNSPDWPTYRHDAARSGATSAVLGTRLKRRWTKALAGPLTAVVVAAGRLYVARREAHTLCALDAGDGRVLWRHTAGGRIDSPPTVHDGRLYFGSADGWMYCLRASDGALAWRFRLAPEARQVVSYGQLESVWPVHGNVLVCAGPGGSGRPVAYAAAGRTSYVDGGVFLCGVDARTGEAVVDRRISHRDPKTHLEPQDKIRGVQMPGAMPDILSTDGTSLFMRHSRFDLAGESLAEDVEHLFSPAGFLDDTWWHRTYWQVGTVMRGGYGGWGAVGNARISGRLLVRAGGRVFGFGRKAYAITGSHLGLQSEYHLFAADAKLVAAPGPAKAKARRRRPRTRVNYLWSKAIGFFPRAMLLARAAEAPAAGRTLFVAGPSDVGDLFAGRPGKAVVLQAVSPADGSKLAEVKLKASPVLDSFAASAGRLYFTTAAGRVVCYDTR